MYAPRFSPLKNSAWNPQRRGSSISPSFNPSTASHFAYTVCASSGSFADDHPEVAEWLSNFTMDSELLYSLENAMFNEHTGDDYEQVVADWIAHNREWVDGLTK